MAVNEQDQKELARFVGKAIVVVIASLVILLLMDFVSIPTDVARQHFGLPICNN